MRLEKIKLAGFKSFVDPTVIHLPSNLVAIVGPNGCGKSNTIDAVRWVMGESSAKMLRGESMADVIFNGSTSRKPVGTASIELLFDNSDGSAGGRYARFGQIAVKRVLSRDGQSQYHLNGARCRRRDITDLFLGTGLGPRSYSIIEQGTISRLIEARPEELRQFLEEAAGISKYKERRRETENRIRHTRENLERLEDLREEVGRRVQRLERQATAAERYRRLRAEQKRLEAERLALRWQAMQADLEARDRALAGLETGVEEAVAGQRRLESEMERVRESEIEAGEELNRVQGDFYAVGAEISRLEQALQYAREARHRHERTLAGIARESEELERRYERDQGRLRVLEETLDELAPRLEAARVEEAARRAAQEAAEAGMQAWQEAWEALARESAGPGQQAQVERARIDHLEQDLQRLARREARLDEEAARLGDPRLEEDLTRLAEEKEILLEREQALLEALAEGEEALGGRREAVADLQRRRDRLREALHADKGRLASLEALQQAALAPQGEGVAAWLEARGLAGAPRLGEVLEVGPRWRRALEVVLGERLQALLVEDPGRALTDLEEGPLDLIAADPEAAPAGSLAAEVRRPGLAGLLRGVRCAADPEAALAARDGLAAGESVVTPEGLWLGRHWTHVPGERHSAAGVLERAAEMRELLARLEEDGARLEAWEEELLQGHEALEALDTERERLRAEQRELDRALARVRAELESKANRLAHLRGRRQEIDLERAELAAEREQTREALEESRARLHRALEVVERLGERRDTLAAERQGLREALEEARTRVRVLGEQAHDLALQVHGLHTEREALVAALQRVEERRRQLQARRAECVADAGREQAPVAEMETALETQLGRRLHLEAALAAARDRLEALQQRLRELDQERLQAEREVEVRREALERARLGRQEVLVAARGLEERLKETGFERPALLQALPADADPGAWDARLGDLGRRIERLGNINLAAIDEFREESERKRYLDDQHADISASLATLEEAIHKIDRETRTRFKVTFERVNAGLQSLFPRLFGGGHAYLELTGEDLLDTGVTVMARPPGKRNASIHLLSGGEKALTAVALVFSIFQLNPAPFCMLDEVDAPLDDANVGRFCELVRSMSGQIQFIFITHNKVTMELADQLMGVTMHEPGVSRLVSVDVDEALEMAAV